MALASLIPALAALAAAGLLIGLAKKRQMEKKAKRVPIPVRSRRTQP